MHEVDVAYCAKYVEDDLSLAVPHGPDGDEVAAEEVIGLELNSDLKVQHDDLKVFFLGFGNADPNVGRILARCHRTRTTRSRPTRASPPSSSPSAATSDVRRPSCPRSCGTTTHAPPAWWSRRARFMYGLLILAIGWGGETWATSRGDDQGHAISTILLLIAGAVMTAAVLAPAWPSVARALSPVGHAAAGLWPPVISGVTAVVRRAGRLAAAMWPPVASMLAGILAAAVILTAAVWRRLSPVAHQRPLSHGPAPQRHVATPSSSATTAILTAIGHLITAVAPPVARVMRTLFTATAHLITGIGRAPLVVGTLFTATGRLITAIALPPARAIRTVFTVSATSSLPSPGYPFAPSNPLHRHRTPPLERRARPGLHHHRDHHVDRARHHGHRAARHSWHRDRRHRHRTPHHRVWRPIRIVCGATPLRHRRDHCHLVASASQPRRRQALTSIGHVVEVHGRPMWSAIARAAATAGHRISTTWKTQRVRLSNALSPARIWLVVVELAIVAVASRVQLRVGVVARRGTRDRGGRRDPQSHLQPRGTDDHPRSVHRARDGCVDHLRPRGRGRRGRGHDHRDPRRTVLGGDSCHLAVLPRALDDDSARRARLADLVEASTASH